MNKRERVLAAINGQEVDHVPSGFWLHFPSEMAVGQAAVDAHINFLRETDIDILKVMNECLYRANGPVSEPADWSGWTPLRANDSHFQRQLDIVKAVVDKVGGEVPILATIHGTFISAFHASKLPEETIFGHNLATEHLRNIPDLVVPAMEAVSDSLIELSLACLEAGADGIYYGAQGGESHRFTEEVFLNYVKPFDIKVLSALADKTHYLFLHVCKDNVRLPLYADYPGTVANWAVHDCDYSLEDGRRLLNRTVLGGLDDRSGVMVEGTEAEIASQVDDIISSAGTCSLILGADCTLPTEISLSRIRAAVEAARVV